MFLRARWLEVSMALQLLQVRLLQNWKLESRNIKELAELQIMPKTRQGSTKTKLTAILLVCLYLSQIIACDRCSAA